MADTHHKLKFHFLLQLLTQTDSGVDGQVEPKRIVEVPNLNGELLPNNTTEPYSDWWLDERTLSGSSETLDLTSLTRGNYSPDRDFTGLKINWVILVADGDNDANGLIVQRGSSAGYPIFGSDSERVTLFPGQAMMVRAYEGWPAVSGTDQNILVSGTAGDTYTIFLIAG